MGKTALISILGNITGHKVVRINLSEQTDIMDLLGSDLPGESGNFLWKNGVFLQVRNFYNKSNTIM